MKALVVMPTYNEAESVLEVLDRVLAADPRVDVLIVDDGSPDGTAKLVADRAVGEPRVHLLERSAKQGLGAAYRAGSPAASGPTTAAVISAVVDSGPTDSRDDEPSSAYRASGARIAHRPATGGSPARVAYAMTWGTRYAATVSPASRSPMSHDRR